MQDLRLAIRALRATPVVSAVAILSLALGIGANTAIFSIVDTLLLRALPVREPRQLVMLADASAPGAQSWTNPIWEQIRSRPQLFDGAFAWSSSRFNLAAGGEAAFVDGIWASGGMFDMLGVPAILGRTFTTADDRRGGGPDGPVAVISYDFWHRRFGGAADAVGRTLNIERVPFTVIGVHDGSRKRRFDPHCSALVNSTTHSERGSSAYGFRFVFPSCNCARPTSRLKSPSRSRGSGSVHGSPRGPDSGSPA